MKLQLGLFVVLASVLVLAKGQSCYYPNGESSKENDIPCSSTSGSACCPQGWACLDNGLCYLDNQKYFGRYTCTDKSWKSPGCPAICTHSNTASGNEAILQCSKGNYCCDANRPDVGCCDTGVSQFALKDGKVLSSGSNSGSSGDSTPSSISASSSSSSVSAASSSSASAASASYSSASASQSSSTTSRQGSSSATTSTQSSLSNSNSGGTTSSSSTGDSSSSSSQTSPSVSIITSVVTSISGSSTVMSSATTAIPILATGTPSSTPAQKNLSAVIGPAVGVPIGIIALAALAFFLWRRRSNHKRDNLQRPMTPPLEDSKSMDHGKPEPDFVPATPDMARYSGNTLTQSPRFSEFAGSPELAGNYPQHYDPQRPQVGELPGSMFHPYNPNLPRELSA